MKPVVTLTLNSSVDVQWEVEEAVPVQKLRSSAPLYFPGGGGINVSRVIKTLGGQTITVHTAGWLTGQFFREMVERQGLLTRTIPIAGATRSSSTIFERSTGHEFRITPPGPELAEAEWRGCLEAMFDYEADYMVLTGSLPPGVPNGFYAQAIRRARERQTRVVLDTSGMALFEALKEGPYLIKPNLREIEHLLGRKASGPEDEERMCRELIDDGRAAVVALTLGADGALLVSGEGARRLASPKVNVKSTVGAGDSFVAGMTLGLAWGFSLEDAFALGVSSGTATVLTAGTELCHRQDVERFFREIAGKPLSFRS